MASLKDIKRHIVAVKQTQKLTKAMNMVAAAKLRSTQSRTERFRNYAEEHARLIAEIARRSSVSAHALLASHTQNKKVLLVVISTERGLCGSFNSNIFSRVDKKILALKEEGLEPELFLVGRKARDYYSHRKVTIAKAMVGVIGNFDYLLAQTITEDLIKSFSAGDFREVILVYTRFETLTKHVVNIGAYLPLSPEVKDDNQKASSHDYMVEPQAEELLARLIPRSLTIKIFRALLETVTSENAARMQAMDNASKSCKDIIESLTMAYNKARQASVTNELLDIVNGAEALKG